jgi:hypothetical protein
MIIIIIIIIIIMKGMKNEDRTCTLIHVISRDRNVIKKEGEKILRLKDLRI